MADCWCEHPDTAHRYRSVDFWPSRTGVVTGVLGRCEAEWYERGGRDRVHCNCEQYAEPR